MFGARQYVAVSLSYLLALFIRLYQFITSVLFKIGKILQIFSVTTSVISRSRANLVSNSERSNIECIHVVANSSLSLMLAFGVLHYHQQFVELIVLVSHNVHYWFIQLVTDAPDFSWFLRSYSVKLFLCHLYLFFGYIGLSAQIALTIDLINLFNLPTIAIYKLLAKIYQLLIQYFQIFVDLLSKKEDHWLSCPYPKWMLRDSCKVVYIGCLPIMVSSMIVVGFYYVWLALVIVVLKIAINAMLNVVILMDQLGLFICILKGISVKSLNNNQKMRKIEYMVIRMRQIEWIKLVEPSMFLQIFKGQDLFTNEEGTLQLENAKTFNQIYNQLVSLIRSSNS